MVKEREHGVGCGNERGCYMFMLKHEARLSS
jgi:hypothetical protein